MDAIEQKKKSKRKYLICLLIIIIATAISFVSSLWGQVDQVFSALSNAKIGWMLIMIGIIIFTYFVEALIIKIFARLYTRKYSLFKGLATSLTGQFYSDITPGASGGQVMQAYTLRNQGIQVSSAASIFVMSFILYQVSLILFDLTSLLVQKEVIFSITTVRITGDFQIPVWPLTIFGFAINLIVTGAIYLLSYSKIFHHFVLYPCINFLGKIKILKNPEKSRENLRISVENYKIELRRLHSNIPVTFLIIVLDLLLLFLRNSIPYFAGLSLVAFADNNFQISKMFDSACLGAFHQMITGLIPLPGSAGVSEYFFEILFYNFFNSTAFSSSTVAVASVQILWRFFTFHFMFIVSAIFVALYPNKPKEEFSTISRKTFVTLQITTLDERKLTADTMYETSRLSRKEILNRLTKSASKERRENRKLKKEETRLARRKARLEKESIKINSNQDDSDWESIDINI